MQYLILAILCGATTSLCMRLSSGKTSGTFTLLCANYAGCMVVGLIVWLLRGGLGNFAQPEQAQLTMIIGGCSGLIFFSALALFQFNVFKNGVILSALFQKLGLLVPIILSLLVFKERPSVLQLIGICLAIGALVLVALPGRSISGGQQGTESTKVSSRGVVSVVPLLVLLLLDGSATASSKLLEEATTAGFNELFFLSVFTVAFAVSLIFLIISRERLGFADVAYGLGVGLPNYIGCLLLLYSLGEVPAVIAFPTFSVSVLALVVVGGQVIFHERMDLRRYIALFVIFIALILLNI